MLQQLVVSASFVLSKMSEDKVGVAEEFWLALARNNREGAQEVVNRLDLSFVAASAYSFEEVEGEFQDAREHEPFKQGAAQGALSPKLLSSDTPKAMIDVWNAEDRLALVVVSSKLICEARFSDGEVDFLACAGSLNCPTASGCGWTTHVTGGRDSKGRPVIKMKLTEGRRRAFAITVKSLGSSVKRPKIYSLFQRSLWWICHTTFCLKGGMKLRSLSSSLLGSGSLSSRSIEARAGWLVS